MNKLLVVFFFFCSIVTAKSQKFAVDFRIGQSELGSWQHIYSQETPQVLTRNNFFWNGGLGVSYQINKDFYCNTSFQFNQTEYSIRAPQFLKPIKS